MNRSIGYQFSALPATTSTSFSFQYDLVDLGNQGQDVYPEINNGIVSGYSPLAILHFNLSIEK